MTDWPETVGARLGRRAILFDSKDEVLAGVAAALAPLSRRQAVLWALEAADALAGALADERPRLCVQTARAWAAGMVKMPVAKRAILDCHAYAKELPPADGARCHAIGQACSVVHTKGHCMGLPVYELSAIVFDLGVERGRPAVENRITDYIDRAAYWQTFDTDGLCWADFLKA